MAVTEADEAWVFWTSSSEFGSPNESVGALEWNGSRWKHHRLPFGYASYGNGGLYDADAAPPREAWVAGVEDRTTSGYVPLLSSWNGSRWILRTPEARKPRGCGGARAGRTPDTYRGSRGLFDVSALSAANVWTAGFVGGCGVAFHWNGRSWQVTWPNRRASRIVAIHVAKTNDVWAIADGWVDGGLGGPSLVMRFDGRRWQTVHSSPTDDMSDVVATPTGELWAVGPTLTIHRHCA